MRGEREGKKNGKVLIGVEKTRVLKLLQMHEENEPKGYSVKKSLVRWSGEKGKKEKN